MNKHTIPHAPYALPEALAETLYETLVRAPAPDWLAEQRDSAMRDFRRQGLPRRDLEDWRYTPLTQLEKQPLRPPGGAAGLAEPLEEYPGAVLAFVDQRPVWLDRGLPESMLCPLAEAVRTERPYHLGKLAGDDALAQLNTALWREGALLRVPENERLRQPVFLRFAAGTPGAMLHPRVLAVMAAQADAILVEHFHGTAEDHCWRNPVTEVVLEAGARLTHIRLVEEGGGATHTARTDVYLGRDSTYRALDLNLSGRLCRHELRVTLAEPGASARLDGLFIADGRRHTDAHLRVAHMAPRTVSRTLYRGLADGRGRGVFDSRVRVAPGASGADAHQSSRNLLLSPHAEIDAKPQLEIYTDAVRCGHGATVGRLDEEALFYLQSRGIALEAARRLLLEAFAGAALGLLADAGLGDWFAPRLAARLPAAVREERP